MRFNTKSKKEQYAQDVINYLTDYGYGILTAKYEVNLWIQQGMSNLSPTVKEDIRRALVVITYNRKDKTS